ncbi:hypothetical protein KC318_g431 [Hortaea werneckii]|nr:hypothetical protein KC334_g399 [Hortaea werneckii]KAI7027342.1 hypothetical protein KC355_g366 [Hortaea werneckii]KAI7676189.1 hypothetical protein KC318_g431 [Hortaea werneckii]
MAPSVSNGDADADLFALAHHETPFRAQAAEFGQRAYVKRMHRYRREWLEFCLRFNIEVHDYDQPFSTPPSLNTIRSFLQFQARYKKGRLEEKLCVRTLHKYWVELQLEIKRQSGHSYTPRQITDMENVIKGDIREKEGLSTKSRPKSLADGPVVRDVLHYLWALDEYEYCHPRMRIQLSFAILLLFYIGLRPGELVESSAHNSTNEGIWYGDLDIRMKADAQGCPEFTVQILIRNRKGRRGQENRAEVENLREVPEERHMCPVTHTLALCFADKVFRDLDGPEDLARIRFPPGRESVRLHIREDKLKVPVIRRLEYNRELCETKIWTADYQCKYLTDLEFVTPAQRRRQMGHMNDDTFQFYISPVSGVDVQSIILGREQDQDTIDWLCSMRPRLDTTAPPPPGSLLSEPRYWRKSAPAKKEVEMGADASTFHKAVVEHNQRLSLFEGTETAAPLSKVVSRPPPSKNLAIYLQYDQARGAVLQHMFDKGRPDCPLPLPMSVTLLYQLALQNPPRWRYPGVSLSPSGACIECGKTPPS